MTHLDNLIQTLGVRLRFCPTQPRCRLGRVVASSSSRHASKQRSRFYSYHPGHTLTTKITDNVSISAAVSLHNLVIVLYYHQLLIPLP